MSQKYRHINIRLSSHWQFSCWGKNKQVLILIKLCLNFTSIPTNKRVFELIVIEMVTKVFEFGGEFNTLEALKYDDRPGHFLIFHTFFII